MPRAIKSQASQIVDFFRKSQIDVAEMVHGLCGDALRERKQKSNEAKARAAGVATDAATASAGKKAKGAKKAKARKTKAPQAAKTNGAQGASPVLAGATATDEMREGEQAAAAVSESTR